MKPDRICHCDNLRRGIAGTFDWSDFEELERSETYPGVAEVDSTDYKLLCPVCGSIWNLQLDSTGIFPKYTWTEIQ